MSSAWNNALSGRAVIVANDTLLLFRGHQDSSCIHHSHHIVCIISCNFSRLNTVISGSCLTALPPSASLLSPLPVRLRSDRLSLIEECIAHCSTAYKQSTTLLNLASLLRVAGTVPTDTLTHTDETVSLTPLTSSPPSLFLFAFFFVRMRGKKFNE